MRELLTGDDWEDMVTTLEQSLSNALGTVRGEPRKVRVLGNAQAGLVWAVGRHFDRTTGAALYGYDRDGLSVTNQGQIRHTPLPNGNPESAQPVNDTAREPKAKLPTVALGIGSQQRYGSHVQAAMPDLPLFWIESGSIENSEQAMALVANIVASVERLQRDYATRELVLFWTTANHVALLAAANLTTHVIPKLKFMERDHAKAAYVHLSMP